MKKKLPQSFKLFQCCNLFLDIYDHIAITIKVQNFASNVLIKADEISAHELEGSRMDDVNKNDDDVEIKNFKKSIWVQDDSSKCRDTFKVIDQ